MSDDNAAGGNNSFRHKMRPHSYTPREAQTTTTSQYVDRSENTAGCYTNTAMVILQSGIHVYRYMKSFSATTLISDDFDSKS